MPNHFKHGRLTSESTSLSLNGLEGAKLATPAIPLPNAFASALGTKPLPGHLGQALHGRPDKKPLSQNIGMQGRMNSRSKPSFVPGKGNK